jgi:hypothetical protein
LLQASAFGPHRAHAVLEQALALRAVQRVALQFQVLIVGGDAGIAEQHGNRVQKPLRSA